MAPSLDHRILMKIELNLCVRLREWKSLKVVSDFIYEGVQLLVFCLGKRVSTRLCHVVTLQFNNIRYYQAPN